MLYEPDELWEIIKSESEGAMPRILEKAKTMCLSAPCGEKFYEAHIGIIVNKFIGGRVHIG